MEPLLSVSYTPMSRLVRLELPKLWDSAAITYLAVANNAPFTGPDGFISLRWVICKSETCTSSGNVPWLRRLASSSAGRSVRAHQKHDLGNHTVKEITGRSQQGVTAVPKLPAKGLWRLPLGVRG